MRRRRARAAGAVVPGGSPVVGIQASPCVNQTLSSALLQFPLGISQGHLPRRSLSVGTQAPVLPLPPESARRSSRTGHLEASNPARSGWTKLHGSPATGAVVHVAYPFTTIDFPLAGSAQRGVGIELQPLVGDRFATRAARPSARPVLIQVGSWLQFQACVPALRADQARCRRLEEFGQHSQAELARSLEPPSGNHTASHSFRPAQFGPLALRAYGFKIGGSFVIHERNWACRFSWGAPFYRNSRGDCRFSPRPLPDSW